MKKRGMARVVAIAALCSSISAHGEDFDAIRLAMPYSAAGAYLTINAFPPGGRWSNSGNPGVWIRSATTSRRRKFIAKIAPTVDGKRAEILRLEDTTPGPLRIVTEAGAIEAAFAGPDVILLRGTAPRIGLEMDFDGRGPDRVPCADATAFLRGDLMLNVAFDVRKGDIAGCEPGRKGGGWLSVAPQGGGLEVAVIDNVAEWDGRVPKVSFDDAVAANRLSFARFAELLPSVGTEFEETRLKAAKTMWMCQVSPRGLVKRHAMFMSKNWMNKIWSWDHVFNAIAMSYGGDGREALDQFMSMFDRQAANGALPDMIGDTVFDNVMLKPPVHGWGLMRILRERPLSDAQLAEVYEPLAKWTEFWLRHRDRDGNGLCEYDQGCDSGWDNSTAFAVAAPIETPELQAYLVLQMEALAHLAGRLGKADEASRWNAKANALAENAITTLFDSDGSPRVRQAFTGEFSQPSTMQTRLGLMFGRRLPEKHRAKIVSEIMSDEFLTPYGIATESVKSPHYRSDGYWRGPIWGPEMMIAYDALKFAGYEKEARDVALRYCRLCAKSGFAENFDALTGEPRRDPAYTWTASTFLVLAHELAVVSTVEFVPRGEDDRSAEVLSAVRSGATLRFAKGEYHFRSPSRMAGYISNHDNPQPHDVFLPVTNVSNVAMSGDGAVFVFHGGGTGLALVDTQRISVEGIAFDWSRPPFTEARVESVEGTRVFFRADPKMFPVLAKDGRLFASGETRQAAIRIFTAFSGDSHNVVLHNAGFRDAKAHGGGVFSIDVGETRRALRPLRAGDFLVLRDTRRPAPGVWLCRAHDTVLEDCTVHAGDGMGMVAQRCRNVTVRGSGTAADCTAGAFPRAGAGRFTALQADATHFSNCAGGILVENCMFERMLDDAINVHATCLKIERVRSPNTILCRYMHPQSTGFEVFLPGERLRFIKADTLEAGAEMTVTSAEMDGDAHVVIVLDGEIPTGYAEGDAVENADWQPSVAFRNNIVRNSTPRGALFTTSGRVVCEGNIFDHVAGQAIHISGDAADWYESGGCRDVQICGNTFRDCAFLSGQAVVQITPNVKHPEKQRERYHRNILIEGNRIETPAIPLLRARSASNLVWRSNQVEWNQDFPSRGKGPFSIDDCTDVQVPCPASSR